MRLLIGPENTPNITFPKCDQGNTPFDIAIENRDFNFVDFLLEYVQVEQEILKNTIDWENNSTGKANYSQ